MKKTFTTERCVCYIMSTLVVCSIILAIVVVTTYHDEETTPIHRDKPIWAYKCIQNKCVKTKIDVSQPISIPFGLAYCRHHCGKDNELDFWPKPTGEVTHLSNSTYVQIKMQSIIFRNNNSTAPRSFWLENEERFRQQIVNKIPVYDVIKNHDISFPLIIDIIVHDADTTLKVGVNESYKLSTELQNKNILATIEANTIFGARHALETLSQLILYDDVSNEMLIRTEVVIHDGPVYLHRGLSLDTARNYFSIKSIKRTIDAMAMVKLNVFHWHLTDTHSFPMVIKSHPYLSKYGAYSPQMIYTAADIKSVIKYAYIRGIRIIPELDAPAHVGEGWQFTNYTLCFGYQPWDVYCVEPPCGQFDPSKDLLYDVLEDIYSDMLDMFDHPELFHMGGDEVMISCWNSSQELQKWMINKGWGLEKVDFMKLWGYFQHNALERLDKVSKTKSSIFLWTSSITENPYLTQYLDKDRYILQFWGNDNEPHLYNLLEKGYKVIISYSDRLYLDCGYESWVGEGNNWCSPYSGWQKIYQINLNYGDQFNSQILGSEGVLWAEQADDQSLDGRLWPRGISLAERLWSDPDTTKWRDAEPRILLQRERFVENGIAAESLQPRWCLQNEGQCPI